MEIIKIHTTTSTNDYLKDLTRQDDVSHFTTVWALHQTAGKGQRGHSWYSEEGKNLMFSVLLKIEGFEIGRQFELNKAISLAVLKVLRRYISNVNIKWPNDILAENGKISGILIENSIHGTVIKQTIVGIGINLNQTEFGEGLEHVTSLKKLLHREFDLEDFLHEVLQSVENEINNLQNMDFKAIHTQYLSHLFGYGQWRNYTKPDGTTFEGKITEVSPDGKLLLEIKNNEIYSFGFQEIKFLY